MKKQNNFEKKKQFLLKHENYYLWHISLSFKFTHQQLIKYKMILAWSAIEDNHSIDWNTDIIDDFKDIFFDKDYIFQDINLNKSLPWSIDFINHYKDLWTWELLLQNDSELFTPEIIKYFAKQFLPYAKDFPWIMNYINDTKNESASEMYSYETDWDPRTSPIEWQYKSEEEIENAEFIDWKQLSHNEFLPWSTSLIEKYERKIRWFAISRNSSIPWSKALLEKYENRWDWSALSANEGVHWTLELIKKYEYKFDWDANKSDLINGKVIFHQNFSKNSGIEWESELLSTYIDKLDGSEISWSKFAKWDIDLLIQFEDFWDYQALATNKIVWDKVFSESINEETIISLLDIILERSINEEMKENYNKT